MRSSAPMQRPSPLALALFALSCGPSVRRDLGSVQLSAITFDDMCHLQDHFDARRAAHDPPLRALNEQSTETSTEERDERGRMRRVVLGEGTYVLSTRTERVRFSKLMREEYRRLPALRLTAGEAEARVHVTWWQAGGIRRVRADGEIELSVGDQTVTLPPHPCVGEFLFGDAAYAMRRCFLAADEARRHGAIAAPCEDERAADAGATPDASVAVSADAPAVSTDASVGG